MIVHFEQERSLQKLIFPESFNDELLDIDHLFKLTNKKFVTLLKDLKLEADFDFTNRDNKKLYTHTFIHTVMEYLKNRDESTKLYFYSNTLTKDLFRNQLIRKVKTIFGFTIHQGLLSLDELCEQLQIGNSQHCSEIKVLFAEDRKPKSFKHIKTHMDKMGLTFLSDQYFKDINNKLQIYI